MRLDGAIHRSVALVIDTPPLSTDPGRGSHVRAELRRGHDEIATDVPDRCKLPVIFDQLALAI
jgi:hypothetical protein